MPAILLCLPPPQGNQSVYSVNWAFGAVVRTEINTTTGHLSVDLISDKIKAIRPCRNLKLGPLVSWSYHSCPASAHGCDRRSARIRAPRKEQSNNRPEHAPKPARNTAP